MPAMLTPKKAAKEFPLALFGIPISNLTLFGLTKACLERISKNKQEGKVSYLMAINGSLVVQCLGAEPSSINNPELLSILRGAEFSFLSGTLLRKTANWLGAKLTPPFSNKELLLSLCQAMGEKEKGAFILSTSEKETKNAAISLHEKFNKLRLVGLATSPVFTEGENLANATERDDLLVEQINSSNADVLFINLESPKQELLLERVRHRLSVPLIIPIDEVLSQDEKEESTTKPCGWMKKAWTEWIRKKRTARKERQICPLATSLKLAWMAAPLIILHAINRSFYHLSNTRKKEQGTLDNKLFLSARRSIAIISLPACLDRSNFASIDKCIEDSSNHDVLIFDFQKVRHIQPEGFYLLIKIWLRRKQKNKEIYGLSPQRDVRWLMKLHRTWDLFHHTLCNSVEILISRLQSQEATKFYDTFTQGNQCVTINLLGRLDNEINYPVYLKKILPMIGQKNCSIDFSYCTYIDNAGLAFLIGLRKHLHSQKRTIVLKSVSKELRKQFKFASVEKLFVFNS